MLQTQQQQQYFEEKPFNDTRSDVAAAAEEQRSEGACLVYKMSCTKMAATTSSHRHSPTAWVRSTGASIIVASGHDP